MKIGPIVLAVVGATALAGCSSGSKSGDASATAATTSAPRSSATPSEPRSVAITKKPTAAGDKERHRKTKEEKMKLGFKGSAGGIDVDSTKTSTVEKLEECLEAKEEVCTKLKVSYKTDDSHDVTTTQKVTLDGKPDPKDKPKTKNKDKVGENQGNVYIVTRDAKAPKITRDDGKPIKPAEINEVKGPYANDGTDGRDILRALPDKVTIGDKLDGLAKVLEAAMTKSESLDKPTSKIEVTVKELRVEAGHTVVVLAVNMEAEGEAKGVGHMKMSSKGSIEFFADGGMMSKSEFTTEVSAKMGEGGEISGTIKETSTVAAEP